MAKTCLYVGSTSLCQLHDVALTPDIAVTPSRLCYPFPFNDDARREQDYLPTANDDSEPFHPRGIPIARGRAATLEDISERTLLTKHVPPIPRIHEDIDESVCSDQQSEQIPSAQMFREEVGILTRYSLPVFACVPKCISNKIAYWLVARMSLNTPLFLCPSSV